MPSSENAHPRKSASTIRLDRVLTVVSEKGRWLIFRELIKGKPLPVNEIARRTGISPGSVSKHMVFLHNCGVAVRGLGGLYELPERFIVPGENALDFGSVLIRLDHLG